MASSLITGAIMIVLLLVAGYVIVGGIVNTSEKLITAHYDASAGISAHIGTDLRLNSSYFINNGYLWLYVKNIGRTPITYPLDLLVIDTDDQPKYFRNVDRSQEYIETESGLDFNTINQGILDPGETVSIAIPVSEIPSWPPRWAEVITKYGVSSSAYLLPENNLAP